MGRRHGLWRLPLLVLAACLSGCVVPKPEAPALPATIAQITGRVQAQSIPDAEADRQVLVPNTQAAVTCNGTTARVALDGTYILFVRHAAHYDCTASAAPLYVTKNASVDSAGQHGVVINFDQQFDSCQSSVKGTSDCGALTLAPGAIEGHAYYQGGQQPARGTRVSCEDRSDLEANSDQFASTLQTTADAAGGFSLQGAPVGTYVCLATAPNGDVQHADAVVPPAGAGHVAFAMCGHNCPVAQYHGGPVMHSFTAYLIFWVPPHYTLDPIGGSGFFESRIAQYFNDVGGTPFYNILSQYWDGGGSPQNAVHVGGSYVDTSPYVHCPNSVSACSPAAGTTQDPLLQNDIQTEVVRAIQAKHWATGLSSEFFVYVGAGVQSCSEPGVDCSYDRDRGACGYHNFAGSSVIYAFIYGAIHGPGPCLFSGRMPSGDPNVDGAIDVTSHEQFESVSDPLVDGWYAPKSGRNNEIGDLCAGVIEGTFSDGGNISLHGDDYLLQPEWDNSANQCAFAH